MSQVSPEDFAQILESVREFIRTRVIPREREIADADAVPDDLRQACKDMGLFGFALPQEWGGLGLDLAQDVELAMELGYTALALRSMFGTNNGIAGQVLVNFGTDEQKSTWLAKIASGEVVASFALTEPGAGSNPAGLRTKAVRTDDGDWVIDGGKCFITNAPTADLFVTFARTRPADADGPGIAVFLVPADAPGVSVAEHDRKMGQDGSWTADVHFDGVRVPASSLVGGSEDVGYRAAMVSLARGRVHISGLAVGAAQRAPRRIPAPRGRHHAGRHADRRLPTGASAPGRHGDPVGRRSGAGPRRRRQVGLRRRSSDRAVGGETVLHRDGR